MITHHPCSCSPGGSLGSCGRGDRLLGPVWRQAGPAAQTRLGAERHRSLQQLHGAVWGPAVHKRYSSSSLDLLQYQREHLFSRCYSSRFHLWSGLCYVVLWCMLIEAWQLQSSFTFIILIRNVILCRLVLLNMFVTCQSSSTAQIGAETARSSTTAHTRTEFGPRRPLRRTRERAICPRTTRGLRMSTTSPGSGRKRTSPKPSPVSRAAG